MFSSIISLLILGVPSNFNETFAIFFLSSLLGIALGKFDFIDLVVRVWITRRLKKSYNLKSEWIGNYLKSEYSRPVFEKITSEFFLMLSFLCASIGALVYNLFEKNYIDYSIAGFLLVCTIGFAFKGMRTAIENFELFRDIVQFGYYQNDPFERFPWVSLVNYKVKSQNRIIEERKEIISQLQSNLSRKEFIPFKYNFTVNVLSAAKSDGETYILNLLGYRFILPNQKIDLKWYTSNIYHITTQIETLYKTGYPVLNTISYNVTYHVEKIAEIVNNNKFTLDILKDFTDYILNNYWLKRGILGSGTLNTIENKKLTKSDMTKITQVGESPSPRSNYLWSLLSMIEELYSYFQATEPIELEIISISNIDYINGFKIPRDGTTPLIIPIHQLEIWLFCQQFKIFENKIYSSYSPEVLDQFLLVTSDYKFEIIMKEFYDNATNLLEEDHKLLFPDFMETRRDKNEELHVYSYRKLVTDITSIFSDIELELKEITRLRPDIKSS